MYVTYGNNAKTEVAKAMHGKARKETKKIEEIRKNERMRHIYHMAKRQCVEQMLSVVLA